MWLTLMSKKEVFQRLAHRGRKKPDHDGLEDHYKMLDVIPRSMESH